jgi:hypothetical protein
MAGFDLPTRSISAARQSRTIESGSFRPRLVLATWKSPFHLGFLSVKAEASSTNTWAEECEASDEAFFNFFLPEKNNHQQTARGFVVIVSTYRTEDPGFESRKGIWFLGLYTLQCCCQNLICIVIIFTWENKSFEKIYIHTYMPSRGF